MVVLTGSLVARTGQHKTIVLTKSRSFKFGATNVVGEHRQGVRVRERGREQESKRDIAGGHRVGKTRTNGTNSILKAFIGLEQNFVRFSLARRKSFTGPAADV